MVWLFYSEFYNILVDVQSWELEDYLCVLMDQEFHTSVEDASLPMVPNHSISLFDYIAL